MAVLWEEIGWVDLETYLRRDDRAILPVGSCEQHGRHLSFATDYLIPTEIAMRVSARTGVPVTPTLCFGMSVHHMEFPGTLSLSPDTFMAVIRDLVESLYRHGRSEEHTSELQSPDHLVCRLLLEKKKK